MKDAPSSISKAAGPATPASRAARHRDAAAAEPFAQLLQAITPEPLVPADGAPGATLPSAGADSAVAQLLASSLMPPGLLMQRNFSPSAPSAAMAEPSPLSPAVPDLQAPFAQMPDATAPPAAAQAPPRSGPGADFAKAQAFAAGDAATPPGGEVGSESRLTRAATAARDSTCPVPPVGGSPEASTPRTHPAAAHGAVPPPGAGSGSGADAVARLAAPVREPVAEAPALPAGERALRPVDSQPVLPSPDPVAVPEPPGTTAMPGAEPGLPAASAMEEMTYWSANGVHTGELRLNDASFEAVNIRVRVDGDEAQVAFATDQQSSRDWLSDSAHRLHDLLGQSGITLTQVSVGTSGQHGQHGRQPEAAAAPVPQRSHAAPSATAGLASARGSAPASRGRLDLFV